MKFIRIAAVMAAMLAVGTAHAQTKSLREQIVGTWIFGVAEVVAQTARNRFRSAKRRRAC